MCCGVVPILFGWLRVASLHALVFIRKIFLGLSDLGISLLQMTGDGEVFYIPWQPDESRTKHETRVPERKSRGNAIC